MAGIKLINKEINEYYKGVKTSKVKHRTNTTGTAVKYIQLYPPNKSDFFECFERPEVLNSLGGISCESTTNSYNTTKHSYAIKPVPKPVPSVIRQNVTSQTQATRRNDTAALLTTLY